MFEEVLIDPTVFDRLRSGAPAGPWVRLLALVAREQGETRFVYGTMMQTIYFDGAQGCRFEPDVTDVDVLSASV